MKCEGKQPGENTPQLAVAQDDLNTGGHYQCPLYRLHGLEEPLLNHGGKNLQIRPPAHQKQENGDRQFLTW